MVFTRLPLFWFFKCQFTNFSFHYFYLFSVSLPIASSIKLFVSSVLSPSNHCFIVEILLYHCFNIIIVSSTILSMTFYPYFLYSIFIFLHHLYKWTFNPNLLIIPVTSPRLFRAINCSESIGGRTPLASIQRY